jgi:hypothetical protein
MSNLVILILNSNGMSNLVILILNSVDATVAIIADEINSNFYFISFYIFSKEILA